MPDELVGIDHSDNAVDELNDIIQEEEQVCRVVSSRVSRDRFKSAKILDQLTLEEVFMILALCSCLAIRVIQCILEKIDADDEDWDFW